MTTTNHLRNMNIPDFFTSLQDCLDSKYSKTQTNLRYKNFNQILFTAGDEEQFEEYRDQTNGEICLPNISLNSNLFAEYNVQYWNGYEDLEATSVTNTFRYIFNKFKKGIFVKIVNNDLRVFLPFSKASFVNEWSRKIHIDPKYKSLEKFLETIFILEGRRNFNPRSINKNINKWYANNCLVRYEYPINEGDTNVTTIKNLLEKLCQEREIPDIEFFINRRDFPLLTKNYTEPYYNIWDRTNKPLVSHRYEKYTPIFSMSKSANYADVLMPTHEDWARVMSLQGVYFPKTCGNYSESFDIPWEEKIPTAIFRGGSTGCGVTVDTNPRLKAAFISQNTEPDENGVKYIDAGITNWNLRPRKLMGNKYLQTIDVRNLDISLVSKMNRQEQSRYKYIINIDGHVTAFRLSIELNMGSVILLVKSSWKIWYSDMLVPYEHYVPVKEDLSDLIDQIKWCRNNDRKCKQIAINARNFYNTYLSYNGVLDFMQKTLVELKQKIGIYLYNTISPLDLEIKKEFKGLKELSYPSTDKGVNDISEMPIMGRSFGLLKGVEWIINMLISKNSFLSKTTEERMIFRNKLGIIRKINLSTFPLVVKTTEDYKKRKEHIHEAFVGIKSINDLTNFIPNFVYIFGLYQEGNSFNLISEYIQGETLDMYIESNNFLFSEFILIILQICLALHMAQNMCCLVHNDLMPWNIIIQRFPMFMNVDYLINNEKVYRVRTNVIPVIIDYGKSHVVVDKKHHGFINMFKVSVGHDMFTLITSSVKKIIEKKRLDRNDLSSLFKLVNFLSNTQLREEEFRNIKDLKDFLDTYTKYSNLISTDKFEIETKSPLDWFNYIQNNINNYRNYISSVKEYIPLMNRDNGRQVFDYILSNNNAERAASFMNVFIRLKQSSLPQPENKLFVYYVVQSLYMNLATVHQSMISFLRRKNIDETNYQIAYDNILKFFDRIYKEKIDTLPNEQIEYDMSSDFRELVVAPYTQETFLLPKEIERLIDRGERNVVDNSDYKEILELMLLYRGRYELSEEDKRYYRDMFRNLLRVNNVNMRNNIANMVTLRYISKKIYRSDLRVLKEKLEENRCEEVEKYKREYEEILEKVR